MGYPAPEYEHDPRREPEDARTAPQAATTSATTTNQTMAINPYPLTSAPPYGRHGDRAGPVRLAPCRTIVIAREGRIGAGARAAAFVRFQQRR